jgi:hypothetical protein
VVFNQYYDNSYPINHNGDGHYTCDGGWCDGIVAGQSNTWYYNAHDQLYDQWGSIYQHSAHLWEDMNGETNGCTVNQLFVTQQGRNYYSDSNGSWWDEFWAFVDVWCQSNGGSDCGFEKDDHWIADGNQLDIQIMSYSGAGFSLSHTCYGTGCGS